MSRGVPLTYHLASVTPSPLATPPSRMSDGCRRLLKQVACEGSRMRTKAVSQHPLAAVDTFSCRRCSWSHAETSTLRRFFVSSGPPCYLSRSAQTFFAQGSGYVSVHYGHRPAKEPNLPGRLGLGRFSQLRDLRRGGWLGCRRGLPRKAHGEPRPESVTSLN